jgi:hypothetical protein
MENQNKTAFDIRTEESIEKHWQHFKENGGYARVNEATAVHLRRVFYAAFSHAVLMIVGRSRIAKDPGEVINSIQEQLDIFWQQDLANLDNSENLNNLNGRTE